MTEHGTGLAASGIFAALSPGELELVSAAARQVRFGAGQRVFSEGTPARGCWLIHDGCVALDLVVPGRGPVVVQTLGPGDVLGWSWLLPPYQWHFGAVATRLTTATELDTDQLRALAEQDTQFGYALTLGLFQACVQRLQATRARLLDLYRSPDEQN
ncbi:MAG TPA: cyclic nucleotide-binding domain-containing protein [Streptosporangiaceae bacterium]|nr:cyclic nucleotide-binding domain-containing protein [Streptosporangiaceae bacterium]